MMYSKTEESGANYDDYFRNVNMKLVFDRRGS